jgi:glucose dehydrogenase
MYVVTPYPNFLYALDLTKPGAPPKWTYKPQPLPASQGVACCDVVNRGAVFLDGKIFYNTLDGQTVAVDAETGQEKWRTKVFEINHGESITMAPLAVKGKILVGNSGGEFGVRGALVALDSGNGKVLWRRVEHGAGRRRPDRSELPSLLPGGPGARTSASRPGRPTCGRSAAARSGAGSPTTRSSTSSSTARPTPARGTRTSGRATTSGRPRSSRASPETGEARWAYQWSPHDLYDYDGVNENVLLDMTLAGKARKVLVHPDRNGYVYVLDRTNGEVLSARPFVHVTTTTGVDLATGRPGQVEEKRPGVGRPCATSVPRPPAERTGSLPPSRRARGFSTSPTTTSARKRKPSRRTTSRARPSSART